MLLGTFALSYERKLCILPLDYGRSSLLSILYAEPLKTKEHFGKHLRIGLYNCDLTIYSFWSSHTGF